MWTKLYFKSRFWLIWLYRQRGFILRGLVAWLIACASLTKDEDNSFDTRLQLRSDQKISSDIVIINFKPSNILRKNRTQTINEGNFWDQSLWTELFLKLYEYDPKSIAVAINFPVLLDPASEYNEVFQNDVVSWSTMAKDQRVMKPLWANYNFSNIGISDFLVDDDGIVRKFFSPSADLPHLAEKATGISLRDGWIPRFINFRGHANSFLKYSVNDVINGHVGAEAFRNKIIVIGAEGVPNSQHLTPVGLFQRAEMVAHIADSLVQNRWIRKAGYWIYGLILLVVVTLSIFIILQYPQSVALMFLLWLGLLTTSLSVWIFDTYYVWIPLVSPLVAIGMTWIIFVGYQANRMERKSWLLQQEQIYLRELEQLKNNFVSLISHDLKTPIAKIQSVVDRLLLQPSTLSSAPTASPVRLSDGSVDPAPASHIPPTRTNLSEPLQSDLKSIRVSSEELNKYIQSILNLLRVESRDFRLNKQVCDINELTGQAVQQLRPLAVLKNIQIASHLEPIFSIEADITLIREVLINIIENAIKYTPVGGRIDIYSEELQHHVRVRVVDTGEGIANNEMESVWNKFVRGKEQDLKTKGSGLGLYLVKYFIELHGGSVDLKSELGRGTELSFTLPIEA